MNEPGEARRTTRGHTGVGLNWAGNYRYRAARIVEPGTIDELRALVSANERVRALGTRHSFNALPDTAGTLVHLGKMIAPPRVDRMAMTTTVDAATPYGQVAAALHQQGLALHNTGSLPHISVAGAIATGTHGSGDTLGGLATAVVALELVTADGEVRRLRRGDPGFEGVVVGLGAFGIVTTVTLEVQPTYDVRQDAFVGLTWAKVISDFDAVMGSAYSVSIKTRWSGPDVGQLWLKTRIVDGALSTVAAEHIGATAAPVELFGDDASSNLTPFGGVIGPWSERLYHFRPDSTPSLGDEIQSEYMVPRERIAEALIGLRRLGRLIDGPLAGSEIRTVSQDDLWLSPAYGRDVVAVHFTWRNDPVAVTAVLPVIEAVLVPLGARPHWGKQFAVKGSALAELYPRMHEWRELRRQWDPVGKFSNEFLHDVIDEQLEPGSARSAPNRVDSMRQWQ